MATYLLERNKKLYYRRRIPKELTKYFPNMQEIRIQVSQRSKFQGIMYAETLNQLFEELMTMLYLDRTNEKDAVVMDYLAQMYRHSEYYEIPKIVIPPIAQFFIEQDEEINQQLLDKTNKLSFLEKKNLLKNLDILDKLVTIIDPKKDFANTSQNNTPALVAKKKTKTFKEVYEIFIKEKQQESGEDIAQSTWRDYQSSYNDFIYVIEDAENMDISNFIREDFRIFVDALHYHLPKSRTKLQKFKALPYSKLKDIELTEDEKLAFDTKKKKISTIKQIFDIALDERYGYIEKNYAEAFTLKENKKNKKQVEKPRHPLRPENLTKLFTSKIYTSEKEQILIHKIEQYWIPIIALYTGMRENEICQLHIEDVKSQVISTGEKVYYFELNEDKNKNLKNKNAYRQVPLHPQLIELGFIKYFNSIKDKQERLWNNLRIHPTQNRYGTDYSKNFMKYFRRHITTEKNQTFHSMRHNVSTKLLNSAVMHKLPKALMNQILGHEPDKDETSQTYSQGYGIEELYEGIKTLDYGDII